MVARIGCLDAVHTFEDESEQRRDQGRKFDFLQYFVLQHRSTRKNPGRRWTDDCCSRVPTEVDETVRTVKKCRSQGQAQGEGSTSLSGSTFGISRPSDHFQPQKKSPSFQDQGPLCSSLSDVSKAVQNVSRRSMMIIERLASEREA